MASDTTGTHNDHVPARLWEDCAYPYRWDQSHLVLYVRDNDLELFFSQPHQYIQYFCGECSNLWKGLFSKDHHTVIGDAVNTAQRLQSAAKENQIIISENSYEKIKESFNCQKVGEVALKNKSNPVMIYEVLD